jgi:hypothetical protein
MAAWPTLTQVRSFLRLQPDSNEDLIIGYALAAAIDYGNRHTGYLWDPNTAPSQWQTGLPDTAFQACLMHAARLYRRRDSIDGALGFGEAGPIRVGKYDPDIDAMYASIGPVVFGGADRTLYP